MEINPTLLDRFWSKVKKSADPDGCWLWLANVTDRGYGMFWYDGTMVRAHRFAYQLLVGPIPASLEVCHNCPGGDNPSCVNPRHLFLGTHTDNMRDMHAKGRANNLRGELHPNAKMTEEQAREALRRYRAGESPSALAREYRVTKQAICRLGKGKNWSMLR